MPMGEQRHKSDDTTKMDLEGMWRNGMVWINLDQNRNQWRTFVNTYSTFRFLKML
jgi:hypothetical protein